MISMMTRMKLLLDQLNNGKDLTYETIDLYRMNSTFFNIDNGFEIGETKINNIIVQLDKNGKFSIKERKKNEKQ